MKKNKKEKPEIIEYPECISASEYEALTYEDRNLYKPVNPKRERFPTFAIICFSLAFIFLVIYIIACINPTFADFFNQNISSTSRMIFAKISGIVPFSIAEMMILLIPLIFILATVFISKYLSKTWKMTWMTVISLVGVLTLMFSVFVLNFATGYKGSPLSEKLNIKEEKVDLDELKSSTQYVVDQTSMLKNEMAYGTDGFSQMPYSFSEMNDKLITAYDKFSEKNNFISNYDSNLKPVMVSELMSYTHITGVYSFFTGEANINVAFPDVNIPFTAAHELAHQRGIAREDEANMIAFLVCMESDDPYIQYSAYFNMYQYLGSALVSTDSDAYKEIYKTLSPEMIGELRAYSKFFDKYRDSTASKVSSVVNDTYLKVQGTEGEQSYGMVVDITVAYFKSKGIID